MGQGKSKSTEEVSGSNCLEGNCFEGIMGCGNSKETTEDAASAASGGGGAKAAPQATAAASSGKPGSNVKFSAGSDNLIAPPPTSKPKREVTPSIREKVINLHAKAHEAGAAAAAQAPAPERKIEEESGHAWTKAEDTAMRLKNVFAAPLTMVADWVAPVNPKTKVQSAFIREALGDNFVFDNLEAKEMKTLVEAFEKYTAKEGDDIITQGAIGDYFYIIETGEVAFTVDGAKVGSAGPQQSFGELALLYDCPRAATCTATAACNLWRVDQNTFRKILASNTMKNDNETKDILRKVPFLKDLDVKFLNRLTDALTTVHFKTGEIIVKKGDEGKVFYIVQSGKVKVTDIEVGSSKYDDQTLGPGDYFGERAIVTKEKRVANITATEDTQTLCLSRDVFVKVLGDLSELVLKSNDKRKLKGIPLFIKADIKDHEMDTLASLIDDMTIEKGMAFCTEGSKVKPAIYLVRTGSVKVVSKGKETIMTTGGYFGDDTIQPDKKGSKEIIATRTAVAEEKCTVGVLSLAVIETVLGDVSRLSSKNSLDKRDKTIKMSDLTKHRILGVGTFGQVWLVSQKGKDEAYALKIQVKRELLNHQQVDGVMREKEIMAGIDHPFIIKLVNTYTDDRSIYMLLKLVQGGELFSVLHTDTRDGVSEKAAMFYSAGILEGLSYMHRRNILYRDLKPENVLIDAKGYTVIVDLGFAKIVMDKTYTLCGTPLYLAPEVILSRGHDKGADYWSWGVLIYEMCVGQTPFYEHGLDQIGLFKRIVKGKFTYPPFSNMSKEAMDLVNRVLVVRPTDRLGNLAGADKDIREHEWFKQLDFPRLVEKKYKAPWAPKIKNALDSSNFDNWDHMAKEVDPKEKPLSKKEQAQFKGF